MSEIKIATEKPSTVLGIAGIVLTEKPSTVLGAVRCYYANVFPFTIEVDWDKDVNVNYPMLSPSTVRVYFINERVFYCSSPAGSENDGLPYIEQKVTEYLTTATSGLKYWIGWG